MPLAVIERDFLKHLSEEFRGIHLTSCVDRRLFMKMTNGAIIYVLVIVSYHIIAGARKQTQSRRINNIFRLNRRLKADAWLGGHRR